MLENKECLRDSTEMPVDPFSDVLKLTNAEAVVTGGFTAGGPWAIRFPGRDKIKFFAAMKGSCFVNIEGEAEPIHFKTGDIGLLASRRSFVLASDLAVTPLDAMDLFSGSGRSMATLGDGNDFAHIGGHVMIDPVRGGMLADILPTWIHARAESPRAAVFRWLLDRLIEERDVGQPGAQLASAQLTQLLFIEILRSHLSTANLLPCGWLRALADPRLAPALRLMHGNPARSWRLEELAKSCAMSRTYFADRFRTVAGIAPLAYLTEWRMHLAQRALREERTAVAVIARSLGYSSESAFSNAFKRVKGISPTGYRATRSLSDVNLSRNPFPNGATDAVL